MKRFFPILIILTACSPPTIEQQHAAAMRQHIYITDMDRYGVEDLWTPSLTGDCEDYVLWMRERVGGQLLHVRTEQGQAHIVLDVDGKIIDNLSRRVYQRSEMKHKIIFEMTEDHVEQFLKARGKR